MSFVVGQWVECVDDTCATHEVENGVFYRVTRVSEGRSFVWIEGHAHEFCASRFRSVTWEVGRTYKTTLEGVTAMITSIGDSQIYGTRSNRPGGGNWCWENDGTGRFCGSDLSNDKISHLTPYLADPEPSKSEPTPVEPASHINQPYRYHRTIHGLTLDLYDLADAYDIKSHRIFHAVKKLVMAGRRGHKDREQDLREAIVSIESELQKMKGGA